MIKPFSLLFYFLAFFTGFFVGVIIAGLLQAGKDQMLAAGAIVLGYGVLGGGIGFIASLFLANSLSRKVLLRINLILSICLFIFVGYFYTNYQKRKAEKLRQKQTEPSFKPKPPGSIEIYPGMIAMSIPSNPSGSFKTSSGTNQTGMGMFTPNFYENPVFYFYGNPTLEKSVDDHTPKDSITFKRTETGEFEIATAPPWLVPAHLKMDYGMLYFKVQTLTHNFLEVTVNETTNLTAYVDKYAGRIQYWPEFLLKMNSVEFPEPTNHQIHVRPFENSGTVTTSYEFLRPLHIKNQWMYVALLGNDYKEIGKGWIQWQKDGELQIRYSLLS